MGITNFNDIVSLVSAIWQKVLHSLLLGYDRAVEKVMEKAANLMTTKK